MQFKLLKNSKPKSFSKTYSEDGKKCLLYVWNKYISKVIEK